MSVFCVAGNQRKSFSDLKKARYILPRQLFTTMKLGVFWECKLSHAISYHPSAFSGMRGGRGHYVIVKFVKSGFFSLRNTKNSHILKVENIRAKYLNLHLIEVALISSKFCQMSNYFNIFMSSFLCTRVFTLSFSPLCTFLVCIFWSKKYLIKWGPHQMFVKLTTDVRALITIVDFKL